MGKKYYREARVSLIKLHGSLELLKNGINNQLSLSGTVVVVWVMQLFYDWKTLVLEHFSKFVFLPDTELT